MTRTMLGCLAIAIGLVAGCSKKHPPAAVERGRVAVTAALDNWRGKEPPAKLAELSEPVEFSEELRQGYELVDYQPGATDATDPEYVRYTVMLTIKDRKGQVSEREVVYAVRLGPPVRVIRDPYF